MGLFQAEAGRGLSLRARLLVLLGLAAALLVADGASDIVMTRADLIAAARERLQHWARSGADRQDGLVSDARAVLTLAAEMSEAAPRAGVTACRQPFGRTVDAIPWLSALVAFWPDGSVICSSRISTWKGGVADRAWFKAALASRGFVLSDFIVSRYDQRPSLVAALPRIVDGEVESVVMARLDLDWLDGLVAKLGQGSGTSVILSDAAGSIVSGYPNGLDLAGRDLAELGLGPHRSGSHDDVFEVVAPDGRVRIYAAAGLPQTGGRVFVGAERDVVLAPVYRQTLIAVGKFVVGFLGCAGILWVGAARLVVRPIEALAGVAARLGTGDLAARADSGAATPEFAGLACAFNAMAASLSQRESELRAANEQLAELATVDPLTGLANRRLFDERLVQAWRRSARDGRPVAAVLIDIDSFKAFNDGYGHPEGDACLRRVARIVGSGLRAGDLAARIGGEEFALLLPGADIHRALQMARLLRLDVEGLAIPHRGNPAGIVTISAGVASLGADRGQTPDDLLRLADGALYRAKRGGRNRVEGASRDVTAIAV